MSLQTILAKMEVNLQTATSEEIEDAQLDTRKYKMVIKVFKEKINDINFA